jgi:predicted XRE-type DNA-binding protein
MITQGALVAQLQARIESGEITQGDVARVLGVSNSRMTELFKHGTYQLRLDQAVKLSEAFGLEQAPVQAVTPLPAAIARLIVLYVAEELGFPIDEHPQTVAALAEDVRAFAELVADPKYRESLDAAEHFFRAMRVRRRVQTEEDRREKDPQNTQ